MKIYFEKQHTKDNKISVCYVVDKLYNILGIKEFKKQQIEIDSFKNELLHDMGVNVMCQQLKTEGEGK